MNFLLKINQYLHRYLVTLGLRRKHRYFGTVYDSQTKQPLDPAVVKLVSVATGEAVESCVTNMAGKYNFFAAPGRYKILVKKSNYRFPSEQVSGEKDGIYGSLYHGEFFDLNGGSDVIHFNIPLDPVSGDWNQKAKQKIMGFFPFFEHFLNLLSAVLFWFVFIMALAGFAVSRSRVALGILIFYGVTFLLALVVPHPRLWGRVLSRNSKQAPVDGVVELNHLNIPDIVIAKSKIFEDGKFFLRAEPGTYQLKIIKGGLEGGDTEVKILRIKIGPEGVINKNIVI